MTNFFSFVAFKHLYVICLWFSFTVPTYRHFCSHRGDIRVTKSEKKTADALEMFQCTKNKKHRIFTEKPTEFVFDPLHCRDFIRKQFLFPVRTSETIYFSLRSRYTTSIKFSIVVFSLSLSLSSVCEWFTIRLHTHVPHYCTISTKDHHIFKTEKNYNM